MAARVAENAYQLRKSGQTAHLRPVHHLLSVRPGLSPRRSKCLPETSGRFGAVPRSPRSPFELGCFSGAVHGRSGRFNLFSSTPLVRYTLPVMARCQSSRSVLRATAPGRSSSGRHGSPHAGELVEEPGDRLSADRRRRDAIWLDTNRTINRGAHVNGSTLTVVLTLKGIIAGSLTSWWFSRSSRRNAEAQRISLQGEIAALAQPSLRGCRIAVEADNHRT
jgi:hypothetical protein